MQCRMSAENVFIMLNSKGEKPWNMKHLKKTWTESGSEFLIWRCKIIYEIKDSFFCAVTLQLCVINFRRSEFFQKFGIHLSSEAEF